MPRTLALPLALVAVVPALAGCFSFVPHGTTRIPHPAHAGYLQPNRVTIEYAAMEQTYALPPGTLSDEASLVTLDPAQICFQMTLRNLAEEATLSDPSRYQISVVANDRTLSSPTLQGVQIVSTSHQGQRPRTVVTGESTRCVAHNAQTGACERWDTSPVYGTAYDPAVVQVVHGTTSLCFPNAGLVDPQTRSLDLELVGLGVTREFYFEWELDVPEQPVVAQQRASR